MLCQGVWADALSCLARACQGDTPLTELVSIGAGAKWRGLGWDQPGAAQPTGPLPSRPTEAWEERPGQQADGCCPRPDQDYSEPGGFLGLRNWWQMNCEKLDRASSSTGRSVVRRWVALPCGERVCQVLWAWLGLISVIAGEASGGRLVQLRRGCFYVSCWIVLDKKNENKTQFGQFS